MKRYISDPRKAGFKKMAKGMPTTRKIEPTFGYLIVHVDENGNEVFDDLCAAASGDWDASEQAELTIRGRNSIAYEISSIQLTGRRLLSRDEVEKAGKRKPRASKRLKIHKVTA
jgi:hypothetical protein